MNDAGSYTPIPIIPSETTEVLYGNDNIIKKTLETFSWVKERMEGSLDDNGPAIHVVYKPIWDGLVILKQNGIRIRVVTEIAPNNISYCKMLLEVCELRHLDGVRTNFAIADGKQALLHGVSQEANPLSQAILTSVKALVQAQEYLFENLWKSAIPAQYKIKEIEDGVKPPFIETLSDLAEIQEVSFELVKSAKQEIQVLLLHANGSSGNSTSLVEELKQLIMQLFNSALQRGIIVRILTSEDIQKQIEELTGGQQKITKRLLTQRQYHKGGKEDITGSVAAHGQGKFEIHLIDTLQQQQRLQTKISFLIVDSRICLVEDLRAYHENNNTNSDSSDQPLNIATYSNSESTVLTYISIFETLWTQTELNT